MDTSSSHFNSKNYWDKRLITNYNLGGVGYYGLGKCFNYWMYYIRKYIFIKNIRTIILHFNDISVLDIGSGTGFYISLWKQLGVKRIIAIDFSETATKNLKQQFPAVDVHCKDISDEITFDEKYDIISGFDVFFHIVEGNKFKQAINNVSKQLKPEGYFILSDNFIHIENNRKSTHHINRTLKDYKNILEDNGFRIIRRVPMFCIMNEPVDTKSKILKIYWKMILRIVPRNNTLGCLIGMLLLPFELFILQFLKEGPSTELMICRKIDIPNGT